MKDHSPISVGDLAEWIIDNRSGSAFKDNTFVELCAGIQEDIEKHNLLFVLDDQGTIIGVMSFLPDRENKILFVRNILVTKHSAMKIFAQDFLERFPAFHVSGNRNNEHIMYNTSRLVNHILNMNGGVY